MSDNCCLPFDVTVYIFKVFIATVFITEIIQSKLFNLKILSELNYPETKSLFLVAQNLTFLDLQISLFLSLVFLK